MAPRPSVAPIGRLDSKRERLGLPSVCLWVVLLVYEQEDCKWKMYMELDGDDIAVTYIKDVSFNTNRPDVDVLKMTKPPFVMDKWILGMDQKQTVDCVINYENDVKSPRSTRYTHQVTPAAAAGDEIKGVELVVGTLNPGTGWSADLRSRSNSDVDPRWMQQLRSKQVRNQLAQEPQVAVETPGHARNLPRFLSAYGDEASTYAAAVRRSPNRGDGCPWSGGDSRGPSPTAGLAPGLRSLHLGSRGSSPSSTVSESTWERERDPRRRLSAGAVHEYRRQTGYGGWRGGAGERRGEGQAGAGGVAKAGRQRSNSYTQARTQKAIPGIQSVMEAFEKEREEGKAGEGGWTKVGRPKRTARPEEKQVRGRGKRGGGGRGGGGGGGGGVRGGGGRGGGRTLS
ncbi:unnamed protein product [Arctogadus glacialis]